MKHVLILFIIGISAMISCKKDPKNETPEPPTEEVVVLSTNYGKMYMWLYKETPLHRNNFLRLIDSGFYQSTEFHRVIQNFVIQGGDPLSKDADRTNDGTGGPGYTIPAEIDSTRFKHKYGAVGAARLSDGVNPKRESSGSQYYIVVNKAGQKSLDGAYTVFGEILEGMNIADSISKVPKNAKDLPNSRIPVDFSIEKMTKDQIKSRFGFTITP